MRQPPDSALSRGQLEAVLRSLRRGTPRPEALRRAGVDPVVFAAEYRRSSVIREAIIRAEGRRPSDDVTAEDQAYLPPIPRKRAAPQAGDAATRRAEPRGQFSGWILWMIILLPLLLAVTLLAAGAAPNIPPLAREEDPPDGVGWHHEWVVVAYVRLPI